MESPGLFCTLVGLRRCGESAKSGAQDRNRRLCRHLVISSYAADEDFLRVQAVQHHMLVPLAAVMLQLIKQAHSLPGSDGSCA